MIIHYICNVFIIAKSLWCMNAANKLNQSRKYFNKIIYTTSYAYVTLHISRHPPQSQCWLPRVRNRMYRWQFPVKVRNWCIHSIREVEKKRKEQDRTMEVTMLKGFKSTATEGIKCEDGDKHLRWSVGHRWRWTSEDVTSSESIISTLEAVKEAVRFLRRRQKLVLKL